MNNISMLGVGNMGSALVRGMITSGRIQPGGITAYDTDLTKASGLRDELGIRVVDSARDAVQPDTDAVFVAVKPFAVGALVAEIADRLHERVVLISIAAGVTVQAILSAAGKPVRVIRAMPNAAAMVGAGVTACCPGGTATSADLDAAVDLFSAVGKAVKVAEKQMNAVTALSASGPGYLFPLMEACADAGVLLGLDRATARTLAIHTFLGAAQMAEESGKSFSELKDMITSPGGTTIAGLRVLERSGVRGALMDTVAAACARANELG